MGQRGTTPTTQQQKKSYSRIDPFLLHKRTLQSISQANIGLIMWSDSVPVTITVLTKHDSENVTTWRMNTFHLFQPKCQERIKQELETYFITNADSVTKDLLLWNTHKVL